MPVTRVHSSDSQIFINNNRLNGVQSFSINSNRELVELGELGEINIVNKITKSNQKVDLKLNFIFNEKENNDPFFKIQSSGIVSVEKFDFKFKDIAGENLVSGAYLTSYGIKGGVGELVEGEVSYEADSITFNNTNKLSSSDQTNDSFGTFVPRKISIKTNFSEGISSSGYNIQSFNLTLPIPRTPINQIGSSLPIYRVPNFPLKGEINFSVIKNDITGLDLTPLVLKTGDISIFLANCNGENVVEYNLNKCSLLSVSESHTLSDEAKIDFKYDFPISKTFDKKINFATLVDTPSALSYSTPTAVYTNGTAITNNTPTSGGGAVVSYSVLPVLPAGLALNATTGIISGIPTVVVAATNYTVTATNTGGSTTAVVSITVNAVVPSALSYSTPTATYTNGTTITNNTPTSGGGAVVSYSVSPALPAGLALNTSTGVISGTPTVVVAATNYTVTATNTGGSTTASVNITIASAVTLGWGTPVLVDNAADTIVTTEGTFVNALRFGSLTNLTINTVTFTGTNTGGTPVNDTGFFAGSASVNLQSLLQNLIYGLSGDTHTITGLTPSRTYMLQWFFADERSGPPYNIQYRNQIVTIAGYSITFPAALVAKATKCYFVATGSSMSLTITGDENGHIEAYQIRDVTP